MLYCINYVYMLITLICEYNDNKDHSIHRQSERGQYNMTSLSDKIILISTYQWIYWAFQLTGNMQYYNQANCSTFSQNQLTSPISFINLKKLRFIMNQKRIAKPWSERL